MFKNISGVEMRKSGVFALILIIPSLAVAANELALQIERNESVIAVTLILTNQDTLSGMQIPLDLSMSNLALQVDSVSFAGSRCQHFFEQFYRVYEDQDKVFIYLIESADPELDSSRLLPGTGPIATIYLTRIGQPLTPRHVIRNNRIDDNEGPDLRYLFWTSRAVEVPCTFNGAEIRLDL
jgi:hypothetical protein